MRAVQAEWDAMYVIYLVFICDVNAKNILRKGTVKIPRFILEAADADERRIHTNVEVNLR